MPLGDYKNAIMKGWRSNTPRKFSTSWGYAASVHFHASRLFFRAKASYTLSRDFLMSRCNFYACESKQRIGQLAGRSYLVGVISLPSDPHFELSIFSALSVSGLTFSNLFSHAVRRGWQVPERSRHAQIAPAVRRREGGEDEIASRTRAEARGAHGKIGKRSGDGSQSRPRG